MPNHDPAPEGAGSSLMKTLPDKWPFPSPEGPQERQEPLVEVRVAKKPMRRPKRDLSNVPAAPF
jgi:hypothetical protein